MKGFYQLDSLITVIDEPLMLECLKNTLLSSSANWAIHIDGIIKFKGGMGIELNWSPLVSIEYGELRIIKEAGYAIEFKCRMTDFSYAHFLPLGAFVVLGVVSAFEGDFQYVPIIALFSLGIWFGSRLAHNRFLKVFKKAETMYLSEISNSTTKAKNKKVKKARKK